MGTQECSDLYFRVREGILAAISFYKAGTNLAGTELAPSAMCPDPVGCKGSVAR